MDITLRTVLRENAAFSVTSGVIAVVGGRWLSEPLGVDARLLVGLGVGLVLYAGYLLWGTAARDRVQTTGTFAVAGDVAWVLAAVAVIATDWLTRTGDITLAVVSVPVLLLAVGQVIGLSRLRRGPARSSGS